MTGFAKLLDDYVGKVLSIAKATIAGGNGVREMLEAREARRALIEYVHELECTINDELPDHYAVDCSADQIAGKCVVLPAIGIKEIDESPAREWRMADVDTDNLPDEYAVDCSADRITGKCYAVAADALPQGAIVRTWDEAKALAIGQPGGRVKKCSSPEEAQVWIGKTLKKPAPALSMVNAKLENILSGDKMVSQDSDDDPPWPLEKNGLPVDGGEDDRSLDLPPW